MAINIRAEETPNPNARRYVVDRPVQEQAKGRFFKAGDSSDEPLVTSLLAVEGVVGVMLLPNSVTVNKDAGADWTTVGENAQQTIRDYFE